MSPLMAPTPLGFPIAMSGTSATDINAPRSTGVILDPAEVIEQVRAAAGPGRLAARRKAEQAARSLLDSYAGRMTTDQVLEFGRMNSIDFARGEEKHGRFAPAFVGATIQRIAQRMDEFNPWAARLWSRDEDEALRAVDELLTNREALWGAGRSLPGLFMYLRDPNRYAVWMGATDRGLQALTGYAGGRRQGGLDAYLRFCEAAHDLRNRYGVPAEELDAILAHAAKITRAQAAQPPDAARVTI